jgi:hypothetical protein
MFWIYRLKSKNKKYNLDLDLGFMIIKFRV